MHVFCSHPIDLSMISVQDAGSTAGLKTPLTFGGTASDGDHSFLFALINHCLNGTDSIHGQNGYARAYHITTVCSYEAKHIHQILSICSPVVIAQVLCAHIRRRLCTFSLNFSDACVLQRQPYSFQQGEERLGCMGTPNSTVCLCATHLGVAWEQGMDHPSSTRISKAPRARN